VASDPARYRYLAFAHARRPLQQKHLGAADPTAGSEGFDPGTLDGRLEGEVEVLQRLPGRDFRHLEHGLDPPLLPACQLGVEQAVEKHMGGHRDLSGATPQRMEAFTNAIRQRIADDPVFEGQWAEVNISRFWTEGIDVEISTMAETRSGRASREATHKLYLDIMQIAQANGLSLAHATDPSGGVAAATQ
jgi:hypothetical protein